MLRECPLTHRCMRGITVGRRAAAQTEERTVTRRAVFLDRDGTLIEEVGYLDRPDRVALYPWSDRRDPRAQPRRHPRGHGDQPVGRRARLLHRGGGRARCTATSPTLLAAGGAHIDAYYYCPHHPDGSVAEYARACDCRKPGRALVDRAVRELGVDPAQSFAVGDRWVDVALARTVGARGVLVRTGYGAGEETRPRRGSRPTRWWTTWSKRRAGSLRTSDSLC